MFKWLYFFSLRFRVQMHLTHWGGVEVCFLPTDRHVLAFCVCVCCCKAAQGRGRSRAVLCEYPTSGSHSSVTHNTTAVGNHTCLKQHFTTLQTDVNHLYACHTHTHTNKKERHIYKQRLKLIHKDTYTYMLLHTHSTHTLCLDVFSMPL